LGLGKSATEDAEKKKREQNPTAPEKREEKAAKKKGGRWGMDLGGGKEIGRCQEKPCKRNAQLRVNRWNKLRPSRIC